MKLNIGLEWVNLKLVFDQRAEEEYVKKLTEFLFILASQILFS